MTKKIYTKTGDEGRTSLLGGTKVQKNDWRLDAYGTVDELNSFIGLLHEKLKGSNGNRETLDELDKIQDNLFKIGSILSFDLSHKIPNLPHLGEEDVKFLENAIDRMDLELAPLDHFIIPGGNEVVALSHVCRTITRRAERCCVPDIQHPIILKYLNRLSDYFFTVCRFCSHKMGCEERIWKG